MKRLASMLLLLLALGLCTSVLVAWAGALVDRSAWPDTVLTRNPTGERTEMRGWVVEQGRDRTLTWRTFAALDLWDAPPDPDAPTTLPAWSVGHALPDKPGPFAPARERTMDVAWEVSAGWPLRCVHAVRHAGPAEFALPGEFVRGGLAAMAFGWPVPADAVAGHERIAVDPWPSGGLAAVVPLRPMLGGMAVNTIVYALAWGVLLSPLVALRAVRRRRRSKKNRCIRCGHARDGLPAGAPCAECGRDLNARTTARELYTARAPMFGSVLALFMLLTAGSALLVHRWMEVDRLPPLHHAAAVGDVGAIERLLTGGAFVLSPCGALAGWDESVEGTTALHWAAARGHAATVRALLSRGAPPHGVNPFDPPLHAAMHARHEDVVALLLAYPEGGGSRWFTGEQLPYTSWAIVDRVLEARRPTLFDRLQVMNVAIQHADLDLYELIVRPLPALRRESGPHVLRDALRADARAWRKPWRHDLGMTAAVLERATVTDQRTLDDHLAVAVRGGVTPAVGALIDAGAEPWPAFMHDAITYGDPTMIAVLARAGVPVEVADPRARSGLWRSVELVRPDFVRAFLDAGADPTFEVAGETAAQMLARVRVQTAADPAGYAGSAYLDDGEAIQRILDLLQAAEAEWAARENPAEDPGHPGGP